MDDSDQNLLKYLIDHDCSCPQCSYNLRGIMKYQCSECGLEFDGYGLDKLLTLRYESVDERRRIRVAQFILVCWLLLIPLIFFALITVENSLVATYGARNGTTTQVRIGSWVEWGVVLGLIFVDIAVLVLLQRGRCVVTIRRQQNAGRKSSSRTSAASYAIIILGGLPLVVILLGVVNVIAELI